MQLHSTKGTSLEFNIKNAIFGFPSCVHAPYSSHALSPVTLKYVPMKLTYIALTVTLLSPSLQALTFAQSVSKHSDVGAIFGNMHCVICSRMRVQQWCGGPSGHFHKDLLMTLSRYHGSAASTLCKLPSILLHCSAFLPPPCGSHGLTQLLLKLTKK